MCAPMLRPHRYAQHCRPALRFRSMKRFLLCSARTHAPRRRRPPPRRELDPGLRFRGGPVRRSTSAATATSRSSPRVIHLAASTPSFVFPNAREPTSVLRTAINAAVWETPIIPTRRIETSHFDERRSIVCKECRRRGGAARTRGLRAGNSNATPIFCATAVVASALRCRRNPRRLATERFQKACPQGMIDACGKGLLVLPGARRGRRRPCRETAMLETQW